jgi:hypothetical protein
MAEANPDDRRDVCAALLTMASITSSYKVESTKDIIQLWDDLRANIPINDDMDYISVLLSIGRISDLQADQINVQELQNIVSGFRSKLTELSTTPGGFTDLGAAYITMSCVSHSNEIESTGSILTLWEEIRSKVPIKDELDFASSVLATGRIMDLRADVKSPELLTEIVTNIRTELENQGFTIMDFKELSILLLAASIVELSPKVEKYRDIVKSWSELKGRIKVSDIKDIVSLILFSGKIRDMDATIFSYPTSITDQINYLRTAMDNM